MKLSKRVVRYILGDDDRHVFQKAAEAVFTELEYSQQKWDKIRPSGAEDHAVDLNSWLVWAKLEIDLALESAYKTFDKRAALHHVRKAAGHLFRAMVYYVVEDRITFEDIEPEGR